MYIITFTKIYRCHVTVNTLHSLLVYGAHTSADCSQSVYQIRSAYSFTRSKDMRGALKFKKNGQRDPDRGIFGLFAFSLVTAFACRKIVDSYSFSRFRDINDKGQIPLRYPGRRSGRRCVHVVCVSQAGRNLVESQLRTGLRPDSSYFDVSR